MVSNDCMQKCTNYPGGRNCSCFEGFQVGPSDNTACVRKYHGRSPHIASVKARLNGFNICPAFVQQKLDGCWANVG